MLDMQPIGTYTRNCATKVALRMMKLGMLVEDNCGHSSILDAIYAEGRLRRISDDLAPVQIGARTFRIRFPEREMNERRMLCLKGI